MAKMYFMGGKGIEFPVDAKGEPICEGDILSFDNGKDSKEPCFLVKRNKEKGFYFGVGIFCKLYLHDFRFDKTVRLGDSKMWTLYILGKKDEL